MKTEYKAAGELGVGTLILYAGALFYVEAEYLKDGTVTGLRLTPVLSDMSPIHCDLTRNPGYLFKRIANPVFPVEPCGSEDDEIMAIGLYVFSDRAYVAEWAEGTIAPTGRLILDSGDIARYGDLIGLIDNGEGFEYRVVDRVRIAKHYALDFTEEA